MFFDFKEAKISLKYSEVGVNREAPTSVKYTFFSKQLEIYSIQGIL